MKRILTAAAVIGAFVVLATSTPAYADTGTLTVTYSGSAVARGSFIADGDVGRACKVSGKGKAVLTVDVQKWNSSEKYYYLSRAYTLTDSTADGKCVRSDSGGKYNLPETIKGKNGKTEKACALVEICYDPWKPGTCKSSWTNI